MKADFGDLRQSVQYFSLSRQATDDYRACLYYVTVRMTRIVNSIVELYGNALRVIESVSSSGVQILDGLRYIITGLK